MRIVIAATTVVVVALVIACSDGNGAGPGAGGGGRSAAPSAGMAGSGAAGKGGAGTGTSSGPQLPAPVAVDLTGLLPTSGQHIVYAGDSSSSASDSVLVAFDLVSGTRHDLNPERANHYHKMVSPDRQTLLFSNVWAGGDRSLHVVRFTAQGVVPAKLVSGYEGFPGTQESVLYYNSHRRNWSEDSRFVGLWRNNSDDDSVDVVDTRSGRLQGALRGRLAKGAYVTLAPRGPFFKYVFLEGMEGRMERSGYARITAQGISMPVDITGRIIDFSPDGARLFSFTSSGEPPNERVDRISVHELATGKETEIATSVEGEQLMGISLLEPDGRHLHGYYEDASGKHVVRRIATDGSTPPAPLSDPALGVLSNIIIARDGSIALHFYAPDPSRIRYNVTDAAGTKRRNLVELPVPPPEAQARWLEFEPIGSAHVYLGDSKDGSPRLAALDRDSGELVDTVVGEAGEAGFGCIDDFWQKELQLPADKLVYSVTNTLGLVLVDLSTAAARRVATLLPRPGYAMGCPIWNASESAFVYAETAVEPSAEPTAIHLVRWDDAGPSAPELVLTIEHDMSLVLLNSP